jgi:hypothetical protein
MKNIPLLRDRLQVLESMGLAMEKILSPSPSNPNQILQSAQQGNPWFTEAELLRSIGALRPWLKSERLLQWLNHEGMPEEPFIPKTIGIIMAGNIPLVNFLDALAVWLSGNKALIKLSSSDAILLPYFIQESGMPESMVEFVDRKLTGYDAVVATGSANSNRYFEYYFRQVPHILRSSRCSAALLNGDESSSDLMQLGNDVFSYYGLGCRNVSHLLLPSNYDFEPMIQCWKESFSHVGLHSRYMNNYDYQKAVLLVANIPFIDGEFFLLTKSNALASPVSVIHYSYYDEYNAMLDWKEKNELQCCVGTTHIPFGGSQEPDLLDYPDDVNLMQFLKGLQPKSK